MVLVSVCLAGQALFGLAAVVDGGGAPDWVGCEEHELVLRLGPSYVQYKRHTPFLLSRPGRRPLRRT